MITKSAQCPDLKALIGHKFSDVTARDPELP